MSLNNKEVYLCSDYSDYKNSVDLWLSKIVLINNNSKTIIILLNKLFKKNNVSNEFINL